MCTDTLALTTTQLPSDLPQRVSIIGVGDIMLGTNFPNPKHLPLGDGSSLMAPLVPLLQSASITFGNLEGAFSDSLPVTKSCRDTSHCYAFRSPDYLFDNIVEAGFDVLSMANNHSGDLGERGRNHTMALIEESGLQHVGLLDHPSAIVERDGIKFGFCAFSPNNGTYDINDLKKAQEIVSNLSDKCHIVVVSFHGGAEGAKYQHVPKKQELFLGERRGDVHRFAHGVIDAGADVILGHGPHVVRAMEIYKDRFIIYSLGNFCTYSRIKISGVNGYAPIIKISTTPFGKFIKGKIHAGHQIKGIGTRLDPNNRAIEKIKNLTLIDFPKNKLTISAQGDILP